jgi:hypothetical protein
MIGEGLGHAYTLPIINKQLNYLPAMDLDVKALESKLLALQDMSSERSISRPASLASTSSEALQYSTLFCPDRPKETEAERIRRNEEEELLRHALWGGG